MGSIQCRFPHILTNQSRLKQWMCSECQKWPQQLNVWAVICKRENLILSLRYFHIVHRQAGLTDLRCWLIHPTGGHKNDSLDCSLSAVLTHSPPCHQSCVWPYYPIMKLGLLAWMPSLPTSPPLSLLWREELNSHRLHTAYQPWLWVWVWWDIAYGSIRLFPFQCPWC